MKLPFAKRDPAAQISKETAASATAAARLAALRSARAQVLLDGDDGALGDHDAQIAAQERQIRVHQERLVLLDAELRKAAHVERERAKAVKLAALEKLLADEVASAARVDKAVLHLQVALATYAQAHDATFANWPSDLFPPARMFSSPLNVMDRFAAVLDIPVHAARVRLPELADRLGSLAEPAAKLAAQIVMDIRNWPLPPLRDDDDDVGPSAASPIAPVTGFAAMASAT
jgi:hypothetical protein